jgi:hypothetical protein
VKFVLIVCSILSSNGLIKHLNETVYIRYQEEKIQQTTLKTNYFLIYIRGIAGKFLHQSVYTITVNHEGILSSRPMPVLLSIEDRPLPVATTEMTRSHVIRYVGRHIKNLSNSLF